MDQRNALKARRDVELAKMKGVVPLCVARYAVRGAPTHTPGRRQQKQCSLVAEQFDSSYQGPFKTKYFPTNTYKFPTPQVFSYKSIVRK